MFGLISCFSNPQAKARFFFAMRLKTQWRKKTPSFRLGVGEADLRREMKVR